MDQQQNSSNIIVIVTVTVVVGLGIALWWMSAEDDSSPAAPPKVEAPIAVAVEPESINEPEPEPAPIVEAPQPVEPVTVSEPEPAKKLELPALDNSDELVKSRLTGMTWRKELLRLMIDQDMIRRFVVFTENFANGTVVYDHSPLVLPDSRFNALESDKNWLWDEANSQRFNLYIELLQSLDSDQLVATYIDFKPLVDKAYAELGYPDSDFTQTLQLAIERVLDMKYPEQAPELVRPSVMFEYADAELEQLSEADKLLLRIGKSNLLVIKSLLLQINEKLNSQIQ